MNNKQPIVKGNEVVVENNDSEVVEEIEGNVLEDNDLKNTTNEQTCIVTGKMLKFLL